MLNMVWSLNWKTWLCGESSLRCPQRFTQITLVRFLTVGDFTTPEVRREVVHDWLEHSSPSSVQSLPSLGTCSLHHFSAQTNVHSNLQVYSRSWPFLCSQLASKCWDHWGMAESSSHRYPTHISIYYLGTNRPQKIARHMKCHLKARNLMSAVSCEFVVGVNAQGTA
jgi:hypothetical protein